MFTCKQKTIFILSIFLEILQRYCKFVILGTLNKPAYKPKMILAPCRKLSYLSAGKGAFSSPMFFQGYRKDMQTSYFGYLRHAWLRTPKMIKPTYVKIFLFLCMPKINFIIDFFLEILHFKESCNSISQQHFGP